MTIETINERLEYYISLISQDKELEYVSRVREFIRLTEKWRPLIHFMCLEDNKIHLMWRVDSNFIDIIFAPDCSATLTETISEQDKSEKILFKEMQFKIKDVFNLLYNRKKK